MNKKTIGALSLTIVLSMLAFSYAIFIVHAFLPADVNQDGVVDTKDISLAVAAFNSSPGSPRWNPNADVDNSSRVDMRDIVIIVLNFGQHE